MNRIIKIGMDVHSKTFNLCAIEANIAGEDKILGSTQVTADYHEVVKFIEGLKKKLNTILLTPSIRSTLNVDMRQAAWAFRFAISWLLCI